MRHQSYREWKSWQSEDFAALTPEDNAYFQAELRRCRIELDTRSSVLEIGFGNGNFAAYCRSIGCSYIGSELDAGLVDRARDRGIEAFDASSPIRDAIGNRQVDLIVAFDVFEHIAPEQLIEMLRDMRNALSRQGHVLARFPCGDSPFSAPLYNGDMTHRTAIGIGKLDQICHCAGMRVVAFHGQTMAIGSLGIMQLLKKLPILLARRTLSWLVNRVYFGGSRLVMEPNMVAVMSAETGHRAK